MASQITVATWLGVLAVGLGALALVLANNQPSPLALRLTWFVAIIPLSVGLVVAVRDLFGGRGQGLTHLHALLRLLPLPAVLFGIQIVIFRMEDPRMQAGPAALGTPAGDATALILYMALWWLLVLFLSAFALDMFRPNADKI
jgi:hypothetical protein